MRRFPVLLAFFSYISQFKAAFWGTAVVFALADIVITLVPWLIGQLTGSLTSQSDSIGFWTAMVIVASIGHDLMWRAGEISYVQLLLTRGHRFDDAIFAAIMRYNYSYFVDKFTGKISSYANSLGRSFRELMDNFHYQYINLVVALPIITATMFSVNWQTGAIFVVSLLLMFVIGRKLAGYAARAERREADEHSTIDGQVVDAIANFVSVKAFGSERHEARRLYNRRAGLIKAARSSYWRAILFWGVMSLFVRWIIWPATFLLNVYLYTQGQIDLAQITTFLAVIVLFSSFIWEVIWNISQINIKLAQMDEAYRYLFGEQNVFAADSQPRIKRAAPSFQHSLELRNVSFAYPDKPEVAVLSNVNLSIGRHEKVGIVGPSGGGKSTLIKLLLGYYPLTSGQILIDGQPVDNRALTALTTYVPQDTAVFHRSIRENIAYARPDASEADIRRAARQAQADGFVMALDKGYDTLVGERGIKLSGGQRQRIAIARALLKDAPLLMLDEATSALDSESEQLIQAALHDLLKQRTALVIAHRLSTIQDMDRIIVFDNGTITEQGSHSQLLKQRGLYATLWSHQSGGFIED